MAMLLGYLASSIQLHNRKVQ